MAMRPSSSSFSYRFSYDVFLSFRGEDTRYCFTGNLYSALRDKGIHTFIDHEELQRGDEITPALEKAIQESRIFIIVLSQNYASSSFCLNELAHILNFIKGKGLLVLPVFHNVEPSHVRHHEGNFGKALNDHEKKYNASLKKLETWKMALSQVAKLSGYPFKDGERYEHEFIKEIVELVSSKINRAPLHVADYPVGLESPKLEVTALLDVGSDDVVHMVGIHGPGGMGKTTLAVAVYNSIADHFEALCFLENVRETTNKHGLTHLQTILLSETIGGKEIKLTSVKQGISTIQHRLQRKKVLLILDDVDKREQLEAIVGRPDWFGLGSRAIITTRNKQLLACHGVKKTYEVKELNKEDALQLFNSKAFKLENFDPSYQDVLNRAVTYASGLPLALEVIGSNLFEKSIEQWESTLSRYKRIPSKEIQEVLKVSYDDLEEDEQNVFLDIACCFKEYTLTMVEDILRAHHGHCMKHHIDVLVKKSLIKISRWHTVTLHDLIEDMGKEIVRKESPKEPGERSRLWFHEDIIQVLEENKGTSRIEIIHMDFPLLKEVEWDEDAFKKMKNLKTLIIRSGLFPKGPKSLPNSLRILEWWRYPSQDFPNDFHPKKLAMCTLPESKCTSNGFAALFEKKFMNLTSLNFDYCQDLTQIPDVSCLEGLELLSFQSCHNLLTIHESVGFLKNLIILRASNCRKLKSFPPIKLTSLIELDLTSCPVLENFPEVLGKMENVPYLSLDKTPIKRFPPSFQNLIGLEALDLGDTHEYYDDEELVSLRGEETAMFILNISKMSKLAEIQAKGLRGWQWPKDSFLRTVCSNVHVLCLIDCNLTDEFFPIALPWFANVKELDLSENNFEFIPKCFKEFRLLTSVTLRDCESLQEIGGIPPNLKCFFADGCKSLTSSCRSMLLSQELHEAGYTHFRLPSAEIPEWFEYHSRGLPISFWIRKELPAIAICLVNASADDHSLLEYEGRNKIEYLYKLEDGHVYSMKEYRLVDYARDNAGNLILIINGKKHSCFTFSTHRDNVLLFDLREVIRAKDEALLKNDWNHVQIICEVHLTRMLMKSGIHVLKQQIMEDIQFIDPCTKRKSNNDLNNSDLESENMDVVEAKMLFWRYPSNDFSYDIGDVMCELPKKSRFTSLELAGFLLKKKFINLKNLNFDYCQSLIEIPDVSCLRQLENLSFRMCENLLTIHDSVGFLEKLKILKAECCCKLRIFPPIKLISLEKLELASCDSLESFPEILGKMENLTKLDLDGTHINLTRLQQLNLGYNLEHTSSCRDAAIFLWNISMMPKLAKIEASGKQGKLKPKEDESSEKVSSTVSSNIQHLSLRNCNLSDDFFPIAFEWFANVKELDLSENDFTVIPESIKECRFLTRLTLERCRYLQEIRGLPPNLKHFSAKEDESAEKVSSTVSSNIQHLSLRNCNLSNEFFPIAFQWFANVKELDLSENNFTVIPESIKECRFLTKLTLERCRCLQEIRGLPPNLKHFSAKECLSLTPSSRSMLQDQELHEAGNTEFYFPGTDIPEWFEYQTWGQSISFRFHTEFPAIVICLVRESTDDYLLLKDKDEDQVVTLTAIINGNRYSYLGLWKRFEMGTTRLFDLQEFLVNFKEKLLENEWNHAEIVYENVKGKSILVKSGIHVLKQQNSMEDIQFIDPQRNLRKLESKDQQLLKKQRLVDTEVADTTL